MQFKEKCKNCTKAIPYGIDALGKTMFGCKNIICIFEPIVENPYHSFIIGENTDGGKNT